MILERHLWEELDNIASVDGLWPGYSISHVTMEECIRRRWARRDARGLVVLTGDGVAKHILGAGRKERTP